MEKPGNNIEPKEYKKDSENPLADLNDLQEAIRKNSAEKLKQGGFVTARNRSESQVANITESEKTNNEGDRENQPQETIKSEEKLTEDALNSIVPEKDALEDKPTSKAFVDGIREKAGVEDVSSIILFADLSNEAQKVLQDANNSDEHESFIEGSFSGENFLSPKAIDFLRNKGFEEEIKVIENDAVENDEDGDNESHEIQYESVPKNETFSEEPIKEKLALEDRVIFFKEKLEEILVEELKKGMITAELVEEKMGNIDLLIDDLDDTEEEIEWQAKEYAHYGHLSKKQTEVLLEDEPSKALDEDAEVEEEKNDEVEVGNEKAEETSELDDFNAALVNYDLSEADLSIIESQNSLAAKQHMLDKFVDPADQIETTSENDEEKEPTTERHELHPTPADEFEKIVPEADRDVSGVESFTKGISEAETIDDVVKVLSTVDHIEGTMGFYTSGQLSSLVKMVQNGEQGISVLTRNAGIREKVEAIINKENDTVETSPVIPTPPIPVAPGVLSQNTESAPQAPKPPEVSEFQKMKLSFVKAQELYFTQFDEHQKALSEYGTLDRLKSVFGTAPKHKVMEERLGVLRENYKRLTEAYSPELYKKTLQEKQKEVQGKVCFGELDTSLQKLVCQITNKAPLEFLNDDVVDESTINMLVHSGAITEEAVDAIKNGDRNPNLETAVQARIMRDIFLANQSKFDEISLRYFPNKDLSLAKRLFKKLF